MRARRCIKENVLSSFRSGYHFIPEHIQLWAKFPVWYHLIFLGTLLPLVALGGALGRSRFPHDPAVPAGKIPVNTISR
jgi:hypothetical protein